MGIRKTNHQNVDIYLECHIFGCVDICVGEYYRKMKSIIIALVLIVNWSHAQSNLVVDWVKDHAVKIDQSFGMSYLTTRHDIQIIGLGEASHGQGSFFTHKANSFKWLVENAGFRIFALEAGFSEALKINDYVLFGNGSAKAGLKYLNYGVWEIQEFVDLIEWMREFNKEKPIDERVKFYGFDCQMAKGGVEYLKSIQRLIDYNFTNSDSILLKDLLKLQSTRDKQLARSILPRLSVFTITLETKILESDQNEDFKKTTITVIKNLLYFCKTEINSERTNSLNRAKYMAENIGHILDIEGSSTKLVLSAHNGHLTIYPKEEETGYWLKIKFGTKYYAFGYEFNQGKILGFDIVNNEVISRNLVIKPAKKGSLGHLLSSAVRHDCILDLRSSNTPKWFYKKQLCSDVLGCYGQIGCNKRYHKINVGRSFDGNIFIQETVASRRI